MSNDIFEMACDLVNPDGGELNEHQENEVQALVNFSKSCNAAMQARIENLEGKLALCLIKLSELGHESYADTIAEDVFETWQEIRRKAGRE